MRIDHDIVIAGGGVAGATAAALLAQSGHRVALIDRQRPKDLDPSSDFDPRVVAIAPGSAAALDAAGAWERLPAERLGPYDRMQVHADGGEIVFRASEHGLAQLGWIVEVPWLQACAWQALAGVDGVELIAPAGVKDFSQREDHVRIERDDGKTLRARLLVAADGARSRLRQMAGIETEMWHYNQQALVCHVATERPNDGIAWQRFTEHGPLALLPLADGRSSIVWSQPERRVAELTALDEAAFLAELNCCLDSPFGEATSATRRYGFPLIRRQAKRLVSGRLVLLGDAARNVHPLAGQGLNLGLMDAAALAEVLADWTGDDDPARILRHYDRWRMSGGSLVAGGIHAINEFTRAGPGRALAGVGFSVAGRLWPLREAFVEHACGLDRDSPKLARSAR
ncbi:NAD(P)-binding protein [Wenzhouxiangella sp. XN201]|uniref:FAD-dependent monooxygenase n=1 Tax=Wenzhouxiangella sp. XN201 TaxID=2710755 RepID=UPI0013C9DA98|nr:FAD-dependent monooxygenase [Wenzhouxiangella sp. XN201]NEZ03229.1 NAD(P)-binding protein [Wenzhouxiangella sp. XN201]